MPVPFFILTLIPLFQAAITIAPGKPEADIGDMPPFPSLWSTKANVSLEAIYFSKLDLLKVTDEDAQAVIRVYVLNRLDHPIKYIGSNVDCGLQITKINANGAGTIFRKTPSVIELQSFLMLPGFPHALNINITKGDLPFFKEGNFSITAQFFDPKDKKRIPVQAPITFR